MSCKHWREQDDEHGMCVEVCKATYRQCSCCAEKSRCDYPSYYEEEEK